MEKKHKHNKLDKLVKAELDRRVRKVEKNLSDDGSFDPDKIDSEVLLQRIKKQIKEKEVQKEKIEQEKEMRVYRRERRVGIVIAVLVGSFLATMTSEANRTYIGDRIRYLVGNEVVIRVGGYEGEENLESEEKERLAYQEIQEKMGIAVPVFKYGLGSKDSFEYNFVHGDSIATIKYQYEDMTLDLCMINKNRTEVSGMKFHGKIIKEVEVMGGLLTIPVQKIKDIEDTQSSYAAQWEYKDGYYQLNGKVGEKEFIEIIENIYY